METLLNEAMEWYWRKELERYIHLSADKREKSVPGEQSDWIRARAMSLSARRSGGTGTSAPVRILL